MEYFQILRRALAISWRHKYLWLLALLAGEGATSVSFGSQYTGNWTTSTSPSKESTQQAWNGATDWLGANADTLWTIAIALAVLCVILFIVSAVANGGLIKAGMQHDAERPYGLRQAWTAGAQTFWPMLGLKFFAFVVCASIAVIIGGLVMMTFVFAAGGTVGVAVLTGLASGILFLVAVPFFILFEVAVLLAARAIVLDGRDMRTGFQSALQLMWRRKGRVALFWLVVLVAGMIASFVAGVAMMGAAAIVVGLAVGAYFTAGAFFAFAVGAGFGVAWLIVLLTISGGVNAFTSTCWTLAYRRFDLEAQPAIAGRPQPA